MLVNCQVYHLYLLQLFNKAYLTSITVESVIIYKNIGDMVDLDTRGKKMRFTEKIRKIMSMKRDPIVSTILSENIITMSSTCVPILSQMGYFLYPSVYWSIGAGSLIGFIQM